MKLSVIDKVKKGLRELQLVNGKPDTVFPYIVDEDYEPAWSEFTTTKVAKDLMGKFGSRLGLYYTGMAFVSHVLSIDKHAIGRNKIDLTKNSADMVDLTQPSSLLYDYLTRHRILAHLKVHSHKVKVTSISYNDFIQAHTGFNIEGYIILKPKGRYTLDGILHDELTPNLFSSVPALLLSRNKGKERKFYSPEQLRQRPNDWYTLLIKDNLKIYAARAKYSTLVIRYNIEVNNLVFSSSTKHALSILEAKWRKTRKL